MYKDNQEQKQRRTRRPSNPRAITCGICGKQFESRYPNVKYCCAECRQAAITQHQQTWRLFNQDYYKRRVNASLWPRQ